MILTCPKCGSRFELDAKLLAPKGKTVKCTSCAEKWHQLPDPQELAPAESDDKIDADFDALLKKAESEPLPETESETAQPQGHVVSIPESVRPNHSKADDLGVASTTTKAAKIKGYAAAAAVFMVVFLGLLIGKNGITASWPASTAFYSLFGIESTIPGDGLVFDRIQAVIGPDELGHDKVIISGVIINLKRENRHVPMIEASLRDEYSEVLERWHIQPPNKILKGEGDMTFKTSYPFENTQARAVNIRFILGKSDKNAQATPQEEKTVPVQNNAHSPAAETESHQTAPQGHH